MVEFKTCFIIYRSRIFNFNDFQKEALPTIKKGFLKICQLRTLSDFSFQFHLFCLCHLFSKKLNSQVYSSFILNYELNLTLLIGCTGYIVYNLFDRARSQQPRSIMGGASLSFCFKKTFPRMVQIAAQTVRHVARILNMRD